MDYDYQYIYIHIIYFFLIFFLNIKLNVSGSYMNVYWCNFYQSWSIEELKKKKKNRDKDNMK